MAFSVWALTSPAGLNKEHFGLILEIWAVCIIKELESLLQLREERQFLHCSLLQVKPSLTLLPCIFLITSPVLVSSPLSANSVCDKHIPFPPSPQVHTCLGSCTLPSIYTER